MSSRKREEEVHRRREEREALNPSGCNSIGIEVTFKPLSKELSGRHGLTSSEDFDGRSTNLPNDIAGIATLPATSRPHDQSFEDPAL